MVQVDVFWSYGIGASLGLAAGRQALARRKLPREAPAEVGGGPGPGSRWTDPFLMRTLLLLALVFAPSGLYLLWNFASWETMHEGTKDMPAWLVCLFGITNVTQGLLGYVVVERLLSAGRSYLAYLQVVAAYFAMLFVLVHGWDGTGFQRFFSPDRAAFESWSGDWAAWLTSDVALTLLAMGAVLVPLLVGLQVAWLRQGHRLAGVAGAPGPVALALLVLATVFAAGLGLAVVAAVLINTLGPALGVPLAVAAVAAAALSGGPVHALYARMRPAGAEPSVSGTPAPRGPGGSPGGRRSPGPGKQPGASPGTP